jgi:D-alanyl-D-alanine carboxypeptidase/D-alanyl-D-alanine-endopeptidase (penicillin-binding protein 4)
MKRISLISSYILFLGVLFILPIKVVQAQHTDLQKKLVRILNQKTTPNAIWSFSIRDEKGDEIAVHNNTMLLTPASNLKLLTTSAILEELGPDFRYVTNIYGEGHQQGSTWIGNLHVVGSGDPSINGDFYENDTFFVFKKWAQQLRSLGIDSISGNIFGNTSFFDDESLPKSWNWSDIPYYYAPEIGPLSFNSNTIYLTITANGRPGSLPDTRWFPFNTDYVKIQNKQLITKAGSPLRESYRRMPGSNTITIANRIPVGYTETESVTISDPAQFFLDSFVKYLQQDGFGLNVQVHEDPFPNDWQSSRFVLLASHESVPLKDLIKRANKQSDNFYCEMFLKTLAHYRHGGSGSITNGAKVVSQRFSVMKLDTTHFAIKDGSGLSYNNLVTTKLISDLLSKMKQSPNDVWYDSSMTIAGVDGTFRNRLKGTPLENNLRGKSGYISGARAFSGYLQAKSGKTIVFSMIANHFRGSTSQIDRVHEAMAKLIYETL